MRVKTYMSTDWIEVHNKNSSYMARIFLTDDDRAYMILVKQNETRFFRVKSKLLRFGEIGFFEKVIEGSEELPAKQAFEMGFISRNLVIERKGR
ncbi:MAG: hypothetical protein ACREAE_01465 [Nitrosopumilaceae archaeon]